MDRLRRLPSGAPEAAHVRAYLQWLWSVPWDVASPEDAVLSEVEAALERDHLGLPKVKERILEYLAVRRLKPDLPGPALCLVGPPGTGKSSLGAAVARALRRPFVRISVSGTSDAEELSGVSRTSPGGQPGRILRALREAGTRNPVLMIDGVDRLSPVRAACGWSSCCSSCSRPSAARDSPTAISECRSISRTPSSCCARTTSTSCRTPSRSTSR
jgi:ATP-dependent Lon protease